MTFKYILLTIVLLPIGCSTTRSAVKEPTNESASIKHLWGNTQISLDYGDYSISSAKEIGAKGKVVGTIEKKFYSADLGNRPSETHIYSSIINSGNTAWTLEGTKGVLRLQLKIEKERMLVKLGCDFESLQITPNKFIEVPIIHYDPFIYVPPVAISTTAHDSFCELRFKPSHLWIEYYGVHGKRSIKIYTGQDDKRKLFGTFVETNF